MSPTRRLPIMARRNALPARTRAAGDVNDLADVTTLVRDLVAAWNAGNPQRFGRLFTRTADYVTADGRRIRGRDAIEGLFDSTEVKPIKVEDGPTARLYDDVATVIFSWVAHTGGLPERRGIISLVALRQEGRWTIDRLQNTGLS
jgi:uncharacterized protein (TIGR02246 family)